MGKASRKKRRTYQTPKRSRSGANTVWYAAAAVLVIAGTLGVALSRSNSASGVPPTPKDHWHAALGVNDCGTWVPNWPWPPGVVTSRGAVGAGAPSRSGSGGQLYAPLHSHDDGLIHIEPLTTTDGGKNATLGSYFKYGGWKLSEKSIEFFNVKEKNGNKCHGKPGVLRWAVNGKEQHGNPAKYKLAQGDVVELVFTTANAKLPPQTEVPSYAGLQKALGITPTTASTTTAPANSSSTSEPGRPPTTVGTTTTSKP
jgi:hypothetical protein